MATLVRSGRDTRSVAVSFPGGVARQCVVQYQPVAGSSWQRHASFRNIDLARENQQELEQRGYRSRVVIHHICPASS